MSTVWAWLLTYLLHSTLLLTAAWLASRWLERPQWQELVWRFAVVGGLITATWQAAAVTEPLAGQWQVADEVALAERSAESRALPDADEADGPRMPADEVLAETAVLPAISVNPPAPLTPSISGSWAAATWMTVAGSLALLFGVAWMVLLRRLRNRVEITAGPLAETLARLCEQAGLRRRVRLFCSPAIDGPLALGFFRPQICVPPRVIYELTPEQQELLLAHELGHIVRSDPAWQTLTRAIEWLAFFQPLNRLARRRLEDLAEELADAWAVEQTGRGTTLAGLLVQVAEWLSHDRLEVAAVGMARRRSPLARRVTRLLAPAAPGSTGVRRSLAAGLVLLLVLAACGLPGVGLAQAVQPASERELSPSRQLAPTGERALEPPPRVGPRPRAELLEELTQLERDLSELAAELSELRPLIQSHPSGPALAPLVQRMTSRIESLRARRDVLWRIESQRKADPRGVPLQ